MLILKYTTKGKRKQDKKKILASVIALSLLSVGTFAWQSFSQEATNEVIEKVDTPGARTHDYFDGTDKNVFVENYATGDYAPDVYARIRLSEYFEYGKGAGNSDADTSNIKVVRGDIKIADTPLFSDVDTWDVYKLGSVADASNESIRTFRDLELGGEIYYMPTFNQDNTSQEAEVKGNYRDEFGEVKEVPYDDYKNYEENDQDSGYVATAAETASTETNHTAKSTENAKIIAMSDWLDLNEEEQIGEYWVFDTTGWAYYAKPIVGATASGLLLDGITQVSNPKSEWYYAIDVKVQLATLGDWGDQQSTEGDTDNIGMYEDLTDDAMELLTKVSAMDGLVKPETSQPEEPEESNLLELIGMSKEELTELVGTDDTLQISDKEYFVLAIDTIDTYSVSGESEGESEAALLWMAEPLNDVVYTYTLLGNSTWSESNIRTVLESVVTNDTVLDSLSLRVDTTVEPYNGVAVDTYDRLYPLSYEEINETYELANSQRAITSADVATYSWLRSPFMETNVIMLHNTNGSVNNFVEAKYIATIRPALWAEL